MVLVSHVHKFIHIRNFKVASTSVEVFFGQFCIDPDKRKLYRFIENQERVHNQYGAIGYMDTSDETHMCVDEIKEVFGEEIFKTYTKFCVVRNPYDRAVSIFHWHMRNQNDKRHDTNEFKKFCRTLTPPTPYFTDNHIHNIDRILVDGKPSCDYYLRYENLKEDMITLLNKLGITDYYIDNLPNFKSGIRPKGKHYREYYDDETREIVYNVFKYEFDMFGYTF
jgi:hypothetical protein